jgi:hypothetical protein
LSSRVSVKGWTGAVVLRDRGLLRNAPLRSAPARAGPTRTSPVSEAPNVGGGSRPLMARARRSCHQGQFAGLTRCLDRPDRRPSLAVCCAAPCAHDRRTPRNACNARWTAVRLRKPCKGRPVRRTVGSPRRHATDISVDAVGASELAVARSSTPPVLRHKSRLPRLVQSRSPRPSCRRVRLPRRRALVLHAPTLLVPRPLTAVKLWPASFRVARSDPAAIPPAPHDPTRHGSQIA